MRKRRKISFKELVIENRKNLINSQKDMELIEKKIEDKHLSKLL
ncbi:FbpB family small basic protein [Pseudalkalibacillus decolorationis]|nr:FbpB family small basic protein [Pseudalkalibacillus decolorationis]